MYVPYGLRTAGLSQKFKNIEIFVHTEQHLVDGVDVDVVSIGRSWIEQHDSLTQVRVDKLENNLKIPYSLV